MAMISFRAGPPANPLQSVHRPGPAATRNAALIVCMAHPRRIAKVAKQIEREVGSLLMFDRVVQEAVCPARKRGRDGALSALASVTDVQLSNDLQVAKIYMSVYSDEVGKAEAMEGLQRLEGYVRGHIGRQMRLRLTPEIRFLMDDSIERSERVLKLLEQVRLIEAGEMEPPPVAVYSDREIVLEVDDEAEEEEDVQVQVGGSVSRRIHGSTGEAIEEGLGPDEVEEMMALFRQEGAGGQRPQRRSNGNGKRGAARPRRK